MNEVIGRIFIGIGVIYNLLACMGLVRMPDIYSRLQTATKAVTVGSSCIMIGVVIYMGAGSIAAKALLCMLFVLLTNPVSAHVIARAAHSSGIRVERVTADGLLGREIESELWDVTRKDDDDERARLISIFLRCLILDVNEHIDCEELFERVSFPLGESEELPPEYIKEKLIQREKEAVTALIPDFAIPHIIIDGKGTFEIIVVRAKKGIYFSEESPKVKSVFIMVGTQDEWHFYLRALATIAKVISTENFFDLWSKAQGEEDIRELLIERTGKVKKDKDAS